jgi:hypothetical protein
MKWLRFTLVVEAIFFLSAVSFFARPGGISQLLLTLSALLLAGSWIIVFIISFFPRNRLHWKKSISVLLLTPLSLFFALFLGRHISDYLFYRDLPRMKEVVALIQNGRIPISDGKVIMPAKYQSLSYGTHAYRDADGTYTVTFFVGGCFPVKHLCYLYRSDNIITPDIRRDWPSGFRREKCWFEVWD